MTRSGWSTVCSRVIEVRKVNLVKYLPFIAVKVPQAVAHLAVMLEDPGSNFGIYITKKNLMRKRRKKRTSTTRVNTWP